jgi:hypothetical protein
VEFRILIRKSWFLRIGAKQILRPPVQLAETAVLARTSRRRLTP